MKVQSRRMHSLLGHWLRRKCERFADLRVHSSIRKDAREDPMPATLPTRYVCEELAGEFANYWARIHDDDGDGLEQIQQNALYLWETFPFTFGSRMDHHPFPLAFFVEVFDNYFFLGSLSQYIQVEFTDDSNENSDWVGLTTMRKLHARSDPPQVRIELKRPPGPLWTRDLMQALLDTLLHEMSHAFLIIYSNHAPTPQEGWYSRTVATHGLTGHGPCWVKIAAAIAAEADRSFGDGWDRWELMIAGSCDLEKEALREALTGIDKAAFI